MGEQPGDSPPPSSAKGDLHHAAGGPRNAEQRAPSPTNHMLQEARLHPLQKVFFNSNLRLAPSERGAGAGSAALEAALPGSQLYQLPPNANPGINPTTITPASSSHSHLSGAEADDSSKAAEGAVKDALSHPAAWYNQRSSATPTSPAAAAAGTPASRHKPGAGMGPLLGGDSDAGGLDQHPAPSPGHSQLSQHSSLGPDQHHQAAAAPLAAHGSGGGATGGGKISKETGPTPEPLQRPAAAATQTADTRAACSPGATAGARHAASGQAPQAPQPPSASQQPPVTLQWRPSFGNPAIMQLPVNAAPGVLYVPDPPPGSSGGGLILVIAQSPPRSSGSDTSSSAPATPSAGGGGAGGEGDAVSDSRNSYERRWGGRRSSDDEYGEDLLLTPTGGYSGVTDTSSSSGEEEESISMVAPNSPSSANTQQQQQQQQVGTGGTSGRAAAASSMGGGPSHSHHHTSSTAAAQAVTTAAGGATTSAKPGRTVAAQVKRAAEAKAAGATAVPFALATAPETVKTDGTGKKFVVVSHIASTLAAASSQQGNLHPSDKPAMERLAAKLLAMRLVPSQLQEDALALAQQVKQNAPMSRIKRQELSSFVWLVPQMFQQVAALCLEVVDWNLLADMSFRELQPSLLQLLSWVSDAVESDGLTTSTFSILEADGGGLLLRAVAGPFPPADDMFVGKWAELMEAASKYKQAPTNKGPVLVMRPGGIQPHRWGLLVKGKLGYLTSSMQEDPGVHPGVCHVHCPDPSSRACLLTSTACIVTLQAFLCWPLGWMTAAAEGRAGGSGSAAAAAAATGVARTEAVAAGVGAAEAAGAGGVAAAGAHGGVFLMSKGQFLQRLEQIVRAYPPAFLGAEEEANVVRGLGELQQQHTAAAAASEVSTQMSLPERLRKLQAGKGQL